MGNKFLNKLNGMYSIVIYDKIKQEILLIETSLEKNHFVLSR